MPCAERNVNRDSDRLARTVIDLYFSLSPGVTLVTGYIFVDIGSRSHLLFAVQLTLAFVTMLQRIKDIGK